MASIGIAQQLGEKSRLERSLGFRLRLALHGHHNRIADGMPEGVTLPQGQVLVKLLELGACSQNRLGRLVLADAATVKGVVDRLRRRGLVCARTDPADGRRLLLSLTPAGETIAGAVRLRMEEAEERSLAPLSAEERHRLLDLMDRIARPVPGER
ncbi:MarR family winged helix-turn-helix transcriptional regulator [Roseomonas sp. GCM10028921]